GVWHNFVLLQLHLPKAASESCARVFLHSSKCSQPAVVFVTRKKQEICANPDARWVKEYMNSLELQKSCQTTHQSLAQTYCQAPRAAESPWDT
ncbi:C-C motif chemokine 5, partial [Lamprotornis superbus]